MGAAAVGPADGGVAAGPGSDGASAAAMHILRPFTIFRAFAASAPAIGLGADAAVATVRRPQAPFDRVMSEETPPDSQTVAGTRPPAAAMGGAAGMLIVAEWTVAQSVAARPTSGLAWGSPAWLEARTYPIPSRFGAVLGWPLEPQPPLPRPRRAPEAWTDPADN